MKTENTTATSTAPSTPHLDFDEILDFVSVKTLDEESLKLLSKVNTHVRECDECLALVNAVETIHNEFKRLKNSGELDGSKKDTPVMDEELRRMIEDVRDLKRKQGVGPNPHPISLALISES